MNDIKFNCNIQKSPLDIKELDLSSFLKENEVIEDIFFEKIIKKLIVKTNFEIKIFNRRGTILKKHFSFHNPNKFQFIAINKELTYILLGINEKTKRQILGYKIKEGYIICSIKNNLEYLIGIFFISKYVFCIVFLFQVKYFYIDNYTEEFQLSKNKIEVEKNNPIKNFYFNRQTSILILERSDNSFDLINLSDEIYFNKIIKTFKVNFNTFSSFMNQFSFIGNLFKKNLHESAKREIIDQIFIDSGNPNQTYTKNQYFLKFIYSKLYFLYLSIESNSLYIFEMKNLEKFPSLTDPFNVNLQISFNLDKNSTLQVTNNLIIVYNFTKQKIDIIDLKFQFENSESKTICRCIDENSFPYLSHKGKQFYFRDGIIEEVDKNKNKKIYIVEFNLEKYYNSFNKEIQSFILCDFLRRNNSEEFILNQLEKIFINQIYDIETIHWIFTKIVNNLKKCFETSKKFLIQKTQEKQKLKFDPKKSIFISIQYKLEKYKNSIEQIKYFTIFENIINNNKNLSIKDLKRIIYYFLDFWNFLIQNQMQKDDYAQRIFYKYIQIMPEQTLREIFLNYKQYPLSKEIGIYLINPERNKKDKLLSQIGYSILQNKENDNNDLDIMKQLSQENFSIFLLYGLKHFYSIGIDSMREMMINKLKQDNKLKIQILKKLKGSDN